MKRNLKLLPLLAVIMLAAACGDDDNCPSWQPKSVINVLANTWVYDDPATQTWERVRFTASGQFYSSYYTKAVYNIEETVNGQFSLTGGNSIVGQYRLGSGTLMNLDWTINKINEIEATFTVNTTGGLVFTYARQIGTEDMLSGQTATPDYAALLPDTITAYDTGGDGTMAQPHITGFSSHDTKVASVSADGTITANSGGRTYIDVVTSEGTAVVEVNVKPSFMDYDYEQFIGADKATIKATFGSSPLSESATSLLYENSTGNFQYTGFRFDAMTGLSTAVSLTPRDGAALSADEVTAYLASRFTVYEQGTTDDYKAYINAATVDKADVGITFDTGTKQLTYVQISHDLFSDYSPLLGKTRDEVAAIMGDPAVSSDNYMAYLVNSRYIFMMMVSFNSGSGVQSTAQGVVLSLSSTADKDRIFEYLNGKYTLLQDYTTDTEKVFITADGMTVIYLDLENNQIIYMPNGTTGSAKRALRRQMAAAAR